jgi:hypothetical protein
VRPWSFLCKFALKRPRPARLLCKLTPEHWKVTRPDLPYLIQKHTRAGSSDGNGDGDELGMTAPSLRDASPTKIHPWSSHWNRHAVRCPRCDLLLAGPWRQGRQCPQPSHRPRLVGAPTNSWWCRPATDSCRLGAQKGLEISLLQTEYYFCATRKALGYISGSCRLNFPWFCLLHLVDTDFPPEQRIDCLDMLFVECAYRIYTVNVLMYIVGVYRFFRKKWM